MDMSSDNTKDKPSSSQEQNDIIDRKDDGGR